jgi:hypothetical protein
MTVAPAHEKLLLCMKWGTRYGSDYVNRLHSMISRHLEPPFRLVCFTDDAAGIKPAVECRPLPPFPGVPEYLAVLPWRKLSLWQRSLGPDLDGRDALVLDLDLVITGPLEDFFTYAPGRYAVIENWTKPGRNIGNTSVFRFTIGKYPEIYDRFIGDPEGLYRREFRVEQEYISATLHPRGEQVFWPKEWVRSFKEELLPAWPLRLVKAAPLPPEARLVIFHGKPDPHEAMVGQWPASLIKKTYKSLRPVPWIGAHWR